MGRSSRNRKIIASLGPSPAELEHQKLLGIYEDNPDRHNLLCKPSSIPHIIRLNGGIDGPYNERILKIPAFGRLFEGKGDYRHDAYARHIWHSESVKLAVQGLELSARFEEGKKKATSIFFKGGKLCGEGERYHPALNNPIPKHFVVECIDRVLSTMHCPHDQKIDAVGLMFAAWFVQKEN